MVMESVTSLLQDRSRGARAGYEESGNASDGASEGGPAAGGAADLGATNC